MCDAPGGLANGNECSGPRGRVERLPRRIPGARWKGSARDPPQRHEAASGNRPQADGGPARRLAAETSRTIRAVVVAPPADNLARRPVGLRSAFRCGRRTVAPLGVLLCVLAACGPSASAPESGSPDAEREAEQGAGQEAGRGAGRAAPEPSDGAAGEPASPSRPATLVTMRIVSLSPAMTRTLVDLGLGDRIVGRTPFCDSVPEEVPVVGSLLDVDYERLLEVSPTHLVIQPAASGTDPEVERLAANHGWTLLERGLDRLEDVEAFLVTLADDLALPASPELSDLRVRCEGEARAIRVLAEAKPAASAPKVLLLVGSDPPTAAGADTFVSQMLVAAGGVNAVRGDGYPELTLEDIVGLDPDVMLVLRELPAADAERDHLLRPLRTTATSAARAGRVALFVNPNVMLPSTQASEVVAALRAALDAASQGNTVGTPAGTPTRTPTETAGGAVGR